MKELYIIKVGTTFPATRERYGDFDTWTLRTIGDAGVDVRVVDAEHGVPLPAAADCAGVIVTGSHSMVTDDMPWSVKLEAWIPLLLEAGVPFLGICYGHQLLARSAGGEVGFHPLGIEAGTVKINLLPDCVEDPLFRSLPQRFTVHASHSQTILRLPSEAVRLAEGDFESNHAIRIGGYAWGVQFHPEYSTSVMRSYIAELSGELTSAGRDIGMLTGAVGETPFSAQVLGNFARVVESRH